MYLWQEQVTRVMASNQLPTLHERPIDVNREQMSNLDV